MAHGEFELWHSADFPPQSQLSCHLSELVLLMPVVQKELHPHPTTGWTSTARAGCPHANTGVQNLVAFTAPMCLHKHPERKLKILSIPLSSLGDNMSSIFNSKEYAEVKIKMEICFNGTSL